MKCSPTLYFFKQFLWAKQTFCSCYSSITTKNNAHLRTSVFPQSQTHIWKCYPFDVSACHGWLKITQWLSHHNQVFCITVRLNKICLCFHFTISASSSSSSSETTGCVHHKLHKRPELRNTAMRINGLIQFIWNIVKYGIQFVPY